MITPRVRRLPVREITQHELEVVDGLVGVAKLTSAQAPLGRKDLVERIDLALHGLCQPLTVLQCRLAMGELIGDADAMREAIRESLEECARMNKTVGTMRAMLQQVMAVTDRERIG
jgi:hypothetical protein